MPPQLLIVGNPDNRRVRDVAAAAVASGFSPPVEWPWLALARGETPPLDGLGDDVVVRIDSAGESFELDRELLALGHAPTAGLGCERIAPADARALAPDRGRLLCPRQHHAGFLVALARLESLLRPPWRVLTPPDAIRLLFDKPALSRRHQALGVPVPPRLDVATPDDLAPAMADAGARRAFVKIGCASSASGLAIADRRPDGALRLTTTVEVAGARRYNTRRLARIADPAAVHDLLAYLLGEGAIVEAAVPKATLDGGPFDCRMLVVDGEVAFTVARIGRSPITNLHLGGRRGDPAAYRAAIPAPVRAAAEADCVRLAEAHGCFQLGCDVAFTRDRAGHVVIEANAFGDLLPRLERDGLDVYRYQLRALGASDRRPGANSPA